MNLGSKLGQWLLARFGTPAPPPAQPRPAPPQPPASPVIYLRDPARRSLSRNTALAAAVVFLAAAWMAAKTFYSTTATKAAVPAEAATAGTIDKERVRRIMTDLARKNADLQLEQEAKRLQAMQQGSPGIFTGYGQQQGAPPPSAASTLAQQQTEHAYKSRFASPVLAVREASARAAVEPPPPALEPAAPPAPAPTPNHADLPAAPPTEAGRMDCLDIDDAGRQLYAMCEGTILEARLENRLVGDFSGPVNAILERDAYSRDRQHLLIPKGTRLLGTATRADRAFQERLAVQFHRILLPDGRGVDLHQAIGLDQAGAVALHDQVNRHIPATVATTVALGSLAAFSQLGTGGFATANGIDLYRQSLAMQAGQTGQQMLGRNLNRPPSLTIREGHPVEIYLNIDVHLPEYQPAMSFTLGDK